MRNTTSADKRCSMAKIELYENFFQICWGKLPKNYSSIDSDDLEEAICDDVSEIDDEKLHEILHQNKFSGFSEKKLTVISDGSEVEHDFKVIAAKEIWQPEKTTDAILVERRYSLSKVKLFEFNVSFDEFINSTQLLQTQVELDEFEFTNIFSVQNEKEFKPSKNYILGNRDDVEFSRIAHLNIDDDWEEVEIYLQEY